MTYKNTFQTGVKQIDREDTLPMGDGVPFQRGVPWRSQDDIDQQEQLTGVPMPAPDLSKVEEDEPVKATPVQCGANTKKGNPCKGWAILPGIFCMVHDI